ncbi:MAG: hypothetical protein V2I36_05560 [Desulfopila sp.]|nr:hypothetical protein [Desulfopila sp.]
MCFGLTEELDRESFACFLQLAGEKKFAETLSQRASCQEINDFVDTFTGLLRRHLSETEYHTLFLKDTSHDNHPPSVKK